MQKDELKNMLRQSPRMQVPPEFSRRVMGEVKGLPPHGLQESVVLFYGLALFFIFMGVSMEIGLRLAGLGSLTEFWLRMQPQFLMLNGTWLVVGGVILSMEGYKAVKATCVAILIHAIFLSGTAGIVMAISRFFIVPGVVILILCLGSSLLLMNRQPEQMKQAV